MRRLTSVFAIGVAVTALSTGCGAGQKASTSEKAAAVPGAGVDLSLGDAKRLGLRDLTVKYQEKGYAAGTNAPLSARIYNQGIAAVKLCDAKATGFAAGVTKASGATTPSASASPSTPASPTTPTTPSAPASPAPAADSCPIGITIPAGQYVFLLPGEGTYLQLNGLTKPLLPGEHVSVRFLFLDAAGKPLEDYTTLRGDKVPDGVVEVPMIPPAVPLPRASSELSAEH